MPTYTQIPYQIVFGTYKHENTLVTKNHEKFFRYIFGILNNKKCYREEYMELLKIHGIDFDPEYIK